MQEARKKYIRIKADVFRDRCSISRYGISDLFKECEKAGYKLIRYPLGEDADLGFTLKKDSDTVIFTNTSVRLSREIFTLAHEIGHSILHMEDAKPYIDDNITISGRSTDDAEQEANYFAACLLMPQDEVDKFLDLELENIKGSAFSAMDIARIMSEFNVSFEMVLNRLESLGKIDAIEKNRLDSEKNERRVGNLLSRVGGNARLNVPCNDIKVPYEYIDHAIYNYNHSAIPLETLENVLTYCGLAVEDVRDRLVVYEQVEDDLDALIRGLKD